MDRVFLTSLCLIVVLVLFASCISDDGNTPLEILSKEEIGAALDLAEELATFACCGEEDCNEGDWVSKYRIDFSLQSHAAESALEMYTWVDSIEDNMRRCILEGGYDKGRAVSLLEARENLEFRLYHHLRALLRECGC